MLLARVDCYQALGSNCTFLIQEISNVILVNTNNPKAYIKRAGAFWKCGRQDDCIADCDMALQLAPGHGLALAAKANAYLAKGDTTNAFRHIEEAIRNDPTYDGYPLLRAGFLNNTGKQQEAIDACNQILRRNPRMKFAHSIRGSAHSANGDYQSAISDFSAAIAAADILESKSTILVDRGIAYTRRGISQSKPKDLKLASIDFTEAAKLMPKNFLAYRNRGVVNVRLGRLREAISDFDKVIELKPNDCDTFRMRANAYGALQELALAERDFSTAVACNTNDVEAYHARGGLRATLGRHTNAIEDFSATLRLNPNYTNAIRARAHLYLLIGQFTNAVPDLLRAMELDPSDKFMRFLLGQAYRALNNTSGAKTNLSEVIRLDSNYADAYEARGILHYEMGNPTNAIDDLSVALKLNSRATNAYKFRGMAFLQAGNLTNGIVDLSQFIELVPTDATAHVFKSVGHFRLKDYSSAQMGLKIAQTFTNEPLSVELATHFLELLAAAPNDSAARSGAIVGFRWADFDTSGKAITNHATGFITIGEKAGYFVTASTVAKKLSTNTIVEFRGPSNSLIDGPITIFTGGLSFAAGGSIWFHHPSANCSIAPIFVGFKVGVPTAEKTHYITSIKIGAESRTNAFTADSIVNIAGMSATNRGVFSPIEIARKILSTSSVAQNDPHSCIIQGELPEQFLGALVYSPTEVLFQSDKITAQSAMTLGVVSHFDAGDSRGAKAIRVSSISNVFEMITSFEAVLVLPTNLPAGDVK